jgi:hypothetical protein
MNLLLKSQVHERAVRPFAAVPGDVIESELHCDCGRVYEFTTTAPEPAMGSQKLLWRCTCGRAGMLVLAPIPKGGY